MTSRRGRGEDSVYLDGDRWRGAASLGYGPDGRRIRKKVSGATKAEVLRKLRDLRSELNAGLPDPDDRVTVARFLERWLTARLPGTSEREDPGQLRGHGASSHHAIVRAKGSAQADSRRC